MLIGTIIAMTGMPVLSGCGGDEFGTVDPNLDLDGGPDAMMPTDDRNATGGRGGAGGSTGTGGKGGAGGNGGGDSAVDDRIDRDGDGPGNVDDAPTDNGTAEASDGHTDDAPLDGPPRIDADAGRVGDASDVLTIDGPTLFDAKNADSDGRGDSPDRVDSGGSADIGCSEPITYYKDADSDGFGTYSEFTLACAAPGAGWSTVGGDCRDDLPTVKPYQSNSPDPPLYSGTGYADASKPQGVSFDYDCSGAEEADPSNAYGVEPACPGVLNCSGVGYAPVNPTRTGVGIDPRCGSTSLKRCQVLLAEGSPALCNVTYEQTTIPYRCR